MITTEHQGKLRPVSSVTAGATPETGRAWSSLRIPELDGIRGCAILSVLLYHYIFCQVTVAPKSMGAYVLKPLTLGWAGVDLFFVLSGFLIAGILMDNRHASNLFSTFYIRRCCRIFPLYYAVFCVFALIRIALRHQPDFQWLFGYSIPLWSYATYSQNILMGLKGGLGCNWMAPTWSLAVEEQFYAFLPLLVWIAPAKSHPWVFAAIGLLAPCLRWLYPGLNAYVQTPWRADSLMMGALLAWHVRNPAGWAWATSHAAFFRVVAGALGIGVLLMHKAGAVNLGAFQHSWLALFFSMFILLCLLNPHGWLARCLRHKALVYLGTLSYGLYMLHQPVSGLVHGALRSAKPEMNTPADILVTTLALGILIGVAHLSFKFMERPLLRFGRRFAYSARGAR